MTAEYMTYTRHRPRGLDGVVRRRRVSSSSPVVRPSTSHPSTSVARRAVCTLPRVEREVERLMIRAHRAHGVEMPRTRATYARIRELARLVRLLEHSCGHSLTPLRNDTLATAIVISATGLTFGPAGVGVAR